MVIVLLVLVVLGIATSAAWWNAARRWRKAAEKWESAAQKWQANYQECRLLLDHSQERQSLSDQIGGSVGLGRQRLVRY